MAATASLHVAASIEEAVRLAGKLAAAHSRRIYVAGGLFLAIEYATATRGGRPQDLHFF
jgi:dihydrofolate synthase / folylpolyglutamate synthase